MTDRELDAAIAEKVMEWKHSTNSGWLRQDGTALWESAWRPSTDRNAAAMVLERIAALGLKTAFTVALETMMQKELNRTVLLVFDFLRAPSRQLMEAALAAVIAR